MRFGQQQLPLVAAAAASLCFFVLAPCAEALALQQRSSNGSNDDAAAAHASALVGAIPAAESRSRSLLENVRLKLTAVSHVSGLDEDLKDQARNLGARVQTLLDSNALDESVASAALKDFDVFLTKAMQKMSGNSGTKQDVPAAGVDGINRSPYPQHVLEQAQERLPRLRQSVTQVMFHLVEELRTSSAVGGAAKHEEEKVVLTLDAALNEDKDLESSRGLDAAVDRMMTLHKALGAAQDFLAQRSSQMEKNQERLHAEIEAKEVTLLRKMLWQRRNLPLRTQLAVLKRPAFAKNVFAKTLLAKHSADHALADQLEEILPLEMKTVMSAEPGADKTDRLAAAGSSGRVHVLSSGLSSMVKNLEKKLASSRDQLRAAMKGPMAGLKPEAAAKLTNLCDAIDTTLQNAQQTHDLQQRLDAMYAMQQRLEQTMASIMA